MSLSELAQKIQSEVPEEMGSSKGVSGWADEEIELPSAPLGQERSSYDMRPGRAPPARGYGRDEAPLPVAIDHSALPRVPPFLAFVANLPYDVTEEDLRSFFSGISIKGIRFPRAGDSGPRGFGYVEFHSVEGLTEALLRNGKSLKGRACRVDLASKREEEARLPTGNWREGHHVVEAPSRPERSAPLMTRAPVPASAPRGDWRATAKPVEAESRPAASHPPVLRADGPKPAAKKPELKLLPRTLPVDDDKKLATEEYRRSSKPNPFGEAKPREVVLAEKDTKETV